MNARMSFFAEADVAEDGAQVRGDLPEAHKCQVLVVLDDFAALCRHQVPAPAAVLGLRIQPVDLPHQIRRMQIPRRLSRNDILFLDFL